MIAKTRLHIICGFFGSNEELSFRIEPEGADVDGVLQPDVYVSCDNCSALTGLDEVIEQKEVEG